jgi:hypothetical protein
MNADAPAPTTAPSTRDASSGPVVPAPRGFRWRSGLPSQRPARTVSAGALLGGAALPAIVCAWMLGPLLSRSAELERIARDASPGSAAPAERAAPAPRAPAAGAWRFRPRTGPR